jgi:hypothetical protein
MPEPARPDTATSRASHEVRRRHLSAQSNCVLRRSLGSLLHWQIATFYDGQHASHLGGGPPVRALAFLRQAARRAPLLGQTAQNVDGPRRRRRSIARSFCKRSRALVDPSDALLPKVPPAFQSLFSADPRSPARKRTDPAHGADLVVDQQHRGAVGTEFFISHVVLLLVRLGRSSVPASG